MKLSGIILGLFLIVHQQNFCNAVWLGYASAVVGLGKFAYEMISGLIDKDKQHVDYTLLAIKNLDREFEYDMGRLVHLLNKLPQNVGYQLDVHDLEESFRRIRNYFEKALKLKKEADNGIIDYNSDKYDAMVKRKDQIIDDDINRIIDKLFGSNTTFMLAERFSENLLKFEDVCHRGMSQLQLLDGLLRNFKFIYSQYYLACKMSFELQDLLGKTDNTQRLRRLNEDVESGYANAVNSFRLGPMSNASTELWKCDPELGYNGNNISVEREIRQTENNDPKYTELRMYTKYIVHEQEFASSDLGTCPKTKCDNIKEIHQCGFHGNSQRACRKTRRCSGKLIECHKFEENRLTICKNENDTAYNRYLSVIKENENAEKFHCDRSSQITYSTVINFGNAIAGGVWWNGGSSDKCDHCDCLCLENEYYIDEELVEADSDKVVTGAKLQVENNTLRIHIKQAKLLANGSIDQNTESWKPSAPINPLLRKNISYYEFKKFSLTPVTRPDNEVVTGLGFAAKELDTKMIYLAVKTKYFDFRSGTFLAPSNPLDDNLRFGDPPKGKYDMSGRDASTKARVLRENKPDSTEEQYVELTISDWAKDGGQSIIPFIDTQNVTANVLLSGASLYIRGQAGYGGFLGIKLFTFDIRNFVDPWAGL